MQRRSTGGPASRRALVAFGVAVVLVVGGCTPPFGDRADKDADDGRPRPELGITPAPLPAEESGATTTTVAGSLPTGTAGGTTTTTARASGGRDAPGGPGASGSGPATTTATTIPDTYRTVATASDRRGDHGADGPGYADLVQLRVDRGTRTMRLVVDVGGDLPAVLATAEVEGLGVDLYRGLGLESAYQVFVDGGSDGWRAFFQVGSDFVQFPGTFRLGGGRLELVVSLSAFSAGEPERASAFADWSRRTDAGARNSEDLLPELGTVTLAR